MKYLIRFSLLTWFTIGLFGQGPTCDMATQNPDSAVTPVDVGTVITLTLVTTNAVSATIDGVPMTAVIGTPGVDPVITWEATHVAVADVTLTAVVTDGGGAMTSAGCAWFIDISCDDPVIVSVAPVGGVGIVIGGTPDCTYTVRVTTHASGSVVEYDVTVGPNGLGTLNIVVPADVWIEVGQQGFPQPTDSARTVPTLSQWGLMAFCLLLLGLGVYYKRRHSVHS